MNYLIVHDMIDMDAMRDKVEDMKNQQYLNMHPFKIWQGNNGNWYTYLPDAQKGRRLIKKSTEHSVITCVINYYKNLTEGGPETVTFYDCFLVWKERQKKCGISDSTLYKYDSDYQRFFLNDNDISNKPITEITDTYIEDFIFRLFNRITIRYQAFKQMFSMMNGIFKKAKRDKIIADNPCDYIDIELYKKRCEDTIFDPEKRVLDQEAREKLLSIIKKDHINKPNYIPTYALELALLTGLRAGELSYLQWEHIKYKEGYILIRGSEKYDQKKKIYWDDLTKTKKIDIFP